MPLIKQSIAINERLLFYAACGPTAIGIPRFHNPDEYGRRKKCSFAKLKLTLREIRDLFTGYSVTSTKSWNSDDRVRDSHYRFEIDFFETPELLEKIKKWKLVLEGRFEQRSIYMTLSPLTWL
jgi:hypothetical protein